MLHDHGVSPMQSMYSSEMQMAGHGVMGTGVQMPSQGKNIMLFSARNG